MIRRYYDDLYFYLYRQVGNGNDALDLTQEVFIAALKGLSSYDNRKSLFRTWLFRIGTYKVIDAWRKVKMTWVELKDVEWQEEQDFDERLYQKELVEAIHQYVAGFRPEIQEIFRLRVYGELSFPEIASLLAQKEERIKAQYYRLMKKLERSFVNMNRKRRNTPFTQDEKEHSIALILKEVNLQPVTFRAFLRSYFQEVGFRYLFWGMGDILFIVGLLLIGIGMLYFPDLHQLLENDHNNIYFTVFMASPLCYALLYFLGIWKERLLGTFELKMTLRVSLKELLILRMLAFSGISLVISVGSNVLLWQWLGQELSLMRLFSLSFSSLFLFANSQLLIFLLSLLIPSVFVRDRLLGLQKVQWSSRHGRNILWSQFASGMTASFLLITCVVGFFGGLLYFTDFTQYFSNGLNSFFVDTEEPLLFSYYQWTFGQWIIKIVLLVYLIGMAYSGILLYLSQTSQHYLSLLMKIIPVAFVYIIIAN